MLVIMDNLFMDSKYKEVKLGDKVKVNKEVMGSRVVFMDNNKEVDMVNSKGDNKVVFMVNNKEYFMGNKVLGNIMFIIV